MAPSDWEKHLSWWVQQSGRGMKMELVCSKKTVWTVMAAGRQSRPALVGQQLAACNLRCSPFTPDCIQQCPSARACCCQLPKPPFNKTPTCTCTWNCCRRRHCIEPRVFARVFHVLSVVELWILAVSLFAAFYATYVEPLPGALKLW